MHTMISVRAASNVLLLVLVASLATLSCSSTVSTRAWRGYDNTNSNGPPKYAFPEASALTTKNPVGICLSGGGSRAFSAALGSLRSLHDLGVLRKAMYLVGVSGGSWATGTFIYAQPSTFGGDDRVLLGPVYSPSMITMDLLKKIEEGCARSAVTKSLVARVMELMLEGNSVSRAWVLTLGEHFLQPRGIAADAYFTWDNATKQDIIERNPQLAGAAWVIPPHELGRPFPILETTFLTPKFALPITDLNFTQSEVTPLYVGRHFVSNISFNGLDPIMVGGMVEPHAVRSTAPENGLGHNSSGLLVVPEPEKHFTLATAIGESSWFPGAFLSSVHFLDLLGDAVEYWSPAEGKNPRQTSMYVGDGGDLENTGLISLLRRSPTVNRIFVFDNPNLALNESWSPGQRPPTTTDIDDTLAAYFGIFVDPTSVMGFDYRMNQVFAESDFEGVVLKLQAGLKAGTGAVATTLLTTVHNPHWGIPAGLCVNITWMYLSRCPKWEAQLSPEMRKLVVPTKDPNRTSSLITSGPFSYFPHYPTTRTELTAEQVNLLASLTGWMVQQHASLFA